MFIPKDLKLSDFLPPSMTVRNVIFNEMITPDYSIAHTTVEVLFRTEFRCDTLKFEIPFGSVYVIQERALFTKS